MNYLAMYSAFGKVKNIPVVLFKNNQIVQKNVQWDETLWIERDEDYYALMSDTYKNKIVRIVTRESWFQSEEI